LDELYTRISTSTKHVLYQYMKDHDISLLNYNFNNFFQHCIQEYQIQVISHHFSNHKIEGLTIIDKLGISFSYEKDNPIVKKNFTLCHELGHFILKHSGTCFTESIENQGNVFEREANIFSAVVLMPDIVLLSKIYYKCNSFQQVQENLDISKQALYFRLLDLLREHIPDKERDIKRAIDEYIVGRSAGIVLLFHEIRKQLIEEFNQYQPSLKTKLQERIIEKGFVSSQELPELLDQKKWPDLKKNIDNLRIWLVYNKGKSLAYAWNCTKISDKDARSQAESQLLLM